MQGDLYITGDPDADALLNTDPLALLIGMLLDQQVPMEWAFGAPLKLKERLGGTLDAGDDRGDAARGARGACSRDRPRCTASRARWPSAPSSCASTSSSTTAVGPRALWNGVDRRRGAVRPAARPPGLRRREGEDLHGAPGQALRHPPGGWEEVAAPFSDAKRRSIADVDSPETLLEVRAWKKAKKAQGKGKDE